MRARLKQHATRCAWRSAPPLSRRAAALRTPRSGAVRVGPRPAGSAAALARRSSEHTPRYCRGAAGRKRAAWPPRVQIIFLQGMNLFYL